MVTSSIDLQSFCTCDVPVELTPIMPQPPTRAILADDLTMPASLFSPFALRDLTLANRIVVSPMAQYSCTDGIPDEYHLVHLGARAMGGAKPACTCPLGRYGTTASVARCSCAAR